MILLFSDTVFVWREIQNGDSHNKYCYVFETKIGRPDFKYIFKNKMLL